VVGSLLLGVAAEPNTSSLYNHISSLYNHIAMMRRMKFGVMPLLGIVATTILTLSGWVASGADVAVVVNDNNMKLSSATTEEIPLKDISSRAVKRKQRRERHLQQQQTQRLTSVEDSPELNHIVTEFEEYVLVSIVAIPALVTAQGLKEVAQAFVDAYTVTSLCSSDGNDFRILEEAVILHTVMDGFGDDSSLDVEALANHTETDGWVPRDVTYLMVTRGRGIACEDQVRLFANATTLMATNETGGSQTRKRQRQLDGWRAAKSSSASKLKLVTKGWSRKVLSVRGLTGKGGYNLDQAGDKVENTSVGKGQDAPLITTGKVDPCDCEGPPMEDFLQVYNDLIENADVSANYAMSNFDVVDIVQLQHIEDCDPSHLTIFNATVELEVDYAILNSDEYSMADLEHAFLEAYNQVNALNGDICDLFFRRIVSVATQSRDNRSRHLSNTKTPLLSLSTSIGRKQRDLQQQQQQQEQNETMNNVTASPGAFPTVWQPAPAVSAPVAAPIRNSHFTPITLFIRATCNRCSINGQRLFDDTGARRRLPEQNDDFPPIDTLVLAQQTSRLLEFDEMSYYHSATDCRCAETAIRRGPTSTEFLEMIQVVASIPIKSLIQVTSPESVQDMMESITATISIQVNIQGQTPESAPGILDLLVQDAYNKVATTVCDPFVRTMIDATLQTSLVVVVVEGNVDLLFRVMVQCQGCGDVFSEEEMNDSNDVRRRELQDPGHCDVQAPLRGPTKIEFDTALEVLLVGNLIPNLGPPTTESPTAAPTTAPSTPAISTPFPAE
jgi:hypothetical protein